MPALSAAGVDIALAPLDSDEIELLGPDRPAHAWSTMKIPVLVALLRARGERGLDRHERRAAKAAVTESDNPAILHLFGELCSVTGGLERASQAIERLLREAGDTRTIVATAPPPPGAATRFGQTEWRPSDAARFYRALARGDLLPEPVTGHVLDLMRKIAPEARWGLAEFPGHPAYKGGWGPEPDGELVRQCGIVQAGSRGSVAIAMTVLAADLDDGAARLTAAAKELRHRLA